MGGHEEKPVGYVGVDIGKDACVATMVTNAGRVRGRLEFANRPDGFAELVARLKVRDKLVMEAGTYMYPLHDHLRRRGYKVLVGHPRAIRQITESEKKTDKHDSEVLAQLARVGYLPPAYVPHPDILRNREVLRSRLDMAYQTTRVKTRIRAFLARQGLEPPEDVFLDGRAGLRRAHRKDSRDLVLGVMADELDSLDARREKVDAVLAMLAVDSPEVKLLMTIPGINYYLALLIVCEVGDVTRFPTRETFRTYAGCAPRMRQSAGRNPAQGTNTNADPRLKRAFSLAAQTAVKLDGPIKDAFIKRERQTKSKLRAHAVARRKMCDLAYAILRSGEPCRWATPAAIERKQTELEVKKDRAERLPPPT